MLPGMWSGWLQEHARLQTFFRLGHSGDDSRASSSRLKIPLDAEFGKRKPRELNCIERPGLSRIKAHMTSSCLNRLCRALVLLAALLEFSVVAPAESLSAIFTNVAPAASPAIPRRASIIFIQCDGLGYGDLSCYGQTKFQTPNLDRLAAEGIRFTNYFAGDAASSPSCAALLLGKDAGHLKQRADADVPLAADDIIVAQILKNSGYHTGLIGEWDLGDENSPGAPWKKGFDDFAGYLNAADAENFYADYIFRYAPEWRSQPDEQPARRFSRPGNAVSEHRRKQGPVYPRFAHARPR